MSVQKSIFLMIAALLLAACAVPASPEMMPTPSAASASPSASPQPIQTPRPAPINPLTGMPVPDAELLRRRPVMIKVSNFPRMGRPHSGLSYADLVFDYYIGFGTNRFLAVFYGQDSPRVGPVRSGRRVDAELVNMYGGVLGYGSADADTDAVLIQALGDYAIAHHQAPCPVFCGQDTHTVTGVFADSAALSRYVTEQGLDNVRQKLAGMRFSENIPDGGEDGSQVNVLFNNLNRAEWRFDVESGRYLRWIEFLADEESDQYEMIPLTDAVTGRQLAFSNVVIISAYYNELAPSAHEIDILGNTRGLPAVFFRDGKIYRGGWAVPDERAPMHFYDAEGKDFPLKPGSTWVVIAGFSSSFREIQPGLWELFFFLP